MSTTPTLPGLAAGRQPYPGGSDRHVPIVPHVLIVGERKGYYLPPPITRAETVYDTPTTIRVRLPGGRQETQQQHKVWAVPDDAAWAEVEAAVGLFGLRLAELADVLRVLGRYKDRLVAAGGLSKAPNPLCLSVARIEDPDKKDPTTWWLSSWHAPRLEQEPIERHTPKMLSGGGTGSYTFSQDNCFVLEDDAAWARVDAAHTAVQQAAEAVEQLLGRLGTYSEALDGRHAARVAGQAPATTPPAPEADKPLSEAEPIRKGGALRLSTDAAAADGWRELAPAQIRRDGGTQARTGNNEDVVEEYTAAMREGRWKWHEGNRLVVFFDERHYWLADGFHRTEAAQRADLVSVPCEVRAGSQRDAVLYAVGANADHGLRRTRDDVRRAIRTLLLDAEWRAWSNAELARRARTTDKTVAAVRAELEATSEIPRLPERVGADGKARAVGRERTAEDVRSAPRDAAHVVHGDIPFHFAEVAGLLRSDMAQAAYTAARRLGPHHDQAMAAIDAAVEGRGLEQALDFLRADPTAIITQYLETGPRRVLALRRTEVLALTPEWSKATPEQPPVIQPDRYTITHISTGRAVAGVAITGRARAEEIFEALAALDWSGVTTQLTVALAEQIARILGRPFPPDDLYQAASVRAQALDTVLTRTTRNTASGSFASAPYYLMRASGARERYDSWSLLLARLDELEQPAPVEAPPSPSPADELRAPTPPEYLEWVDRAHAVGCGLSRDDQGRYVLIEPDGTRSLYPYWLGALGRVRHFETTQPAPAPPEAEEPDAIPADQRASYASAEQALAADLKAVPARLKRLLRLIWAIYTDGDEPLSEDELWDELTSGLIAADDEALAWALGETGASLPPAPADGQYPAGLDYLTADLLCAELDLSNRGEPPAAGDVARWQDALDALAEELDDTAYERIAHRIGELRRAAQEVLA